MTSLVHVEVRDRVGVVRLSRPERRNALTSSGLRELVAVLSELGTDGEVDVLLLEAEDPSFCAGLDLGDLGRGDLDISSMTREGDPWPVLEKPLVGAVNGPAVTGGLELALRCDVLVASERASFGDSHARVGIMPFWGLTAALPRAVGVRQATYMSLTGDFLSASDALRLGLVAVVVPHEQLQAAAWKVASDIASADQQVVRRLLAAYRDNAGATDAQARSAEQRRALEWQGDGFDAAALTERRGAVVATGRSQAGSPP